MIYYGLNFTASAHWGNQVLLNVTSALFFHGLSSPRVCPDAPCMPLSQPPPMRFLVSLKYCWNKPWPWFLWWTDHNSLFWYWVCFGYLLSIEYWSYTAHNILINSIRLCWMVSCINWGAGRSFACSSDIPNWPHFYCFQRYPEFFHFLGVTQFLVVSFSRH